MDMFKTVKSVGESVISSAKSVGTSIYSSTKEQSELASLNVQKSVIEMNLNSTYAEIGKKYVEYVRTCQGGDIFNVRELLESIQPDLEKLEEINGQIELKQAEIKQATEEKQKKKAFTVFEAEKTKLDKALELDIITAEEYKVKLDNAQKKLDNYELLRKIEMQLEMGIITREEYDTKVKSVLG